MNLVDHGLIVFDGRLAPGAPDWVYLPFEVPVGVRRIRVSYEYDEPEVPDGTLGNACDIGIFDQRGVGPRTSGFRGWSGGARSEFMIGTDAATPGYLAGPIDPGLWQVVLGPYRVCSAGMRYRVQVELDSGPAIAAPRPAYPPLESPGRTAGWFRGDAHLHSIYSDGDRTPEQIAAAARGAGLDFIVSTEHNTPASHGVWGPLAGEDLLIITGEEVTTRNGHLLALGIDPGSWIDWRFRAVDDQLGRVVQQIHDHHGIAVAAHPHSAILGGRWKFGFDQLDAIEVWNGVWTSGDESAVDIWDAQLSGPRGHRWLPAMGNSDAHGEPNALGLPQTVVSAEALSRSALLGAISAGHCWIAESAELMIDFEVVAEDRRAGIGERLAVEADASVEVRASITGVPGGLLRLITDQGQVLQQPLGPDGAGSLIWSTTASLTAFVRLEVRHPRADGTLGSGTVESVEPPLGPMAALTNPIFLDVSPGPASARPAAVPLAGSRC